MWPGIVAGGRLELRPRILPRFRTNPWRSRRAALGPKTTQYLSRILGLQGAFPEHRYNFGAIPQNAPGFGARITANPGHPIDDFVLRRSQQIFQLLTLGFVFAHQQICLNHPLPPPASEGNPFHNISNSQVSTHPAWSQPYWASRSITLPHPSRNQRYHTVVSALGPA